MTTPHSQVSVHPVQLPGGLALIAAGREAFRKVPGLRMLLVKGFLLLYGLFAVLGTASLALLYRYAIRPWIERIESYQTDGGFFMDLLLPLLNGLLWLGQVMLMVAVLLLAMLLTLSLMTLWFEALADRIVRHQRGLQDAGGGFSLGAWAGSILRALRESLWLLLLAVFSVLLGFVPLGGPVLVFLINGYLFGWEAREPYLLVREGLGDDRKALRRGMTLWTIRIGAVPVVLAMIPVVGWLALPMVLIYQVAGLAWANEPRRDGAAPAGV